MAYDLIENDQIVESVNALPHGWRNVSGLNLLSAEELATHGWLPRIETRAPLGPYQRHGEPAKVIHADHTEWIYPVLTESIETAAERKIGEINAEASRRIYAAFPIEKQINCADGVYTNATWCDSRRDYKATVIAASNDATNAVAAITADPAGTVAAIAAVTVNWPQEPTP